MVNVAQEVKFAQGMVDRRRQTVDAIGFESSKGEAMDNFRSMLVCLKECEKHHNNVMVNISDETAGAGVETSALVDYSRKWVAQAEHNLRTVWEVSDLRIEDARRGLGLL